MCRSIDVDAESVDIELQIPGHVAAEIQMDGVAGLEQVLFQRGEPNCFHPPAQELLRRSHRLEFPLQQNRSGFPHDSTGQADPVHLETPSGACLPCWRLGHPAVLAGTLTL